MKYSLASTLANCWRAANANVLVDIRQKVKVARHVSVLKWVIAMGDEANVQVLVAVP